MTETTHTMQTIHRSPLAAALVAALAFSGVAAPVGAQDAPGWLNWGGGSDEPAADERDGREATNDGDAGADNPSVPSASVSVADAGNPSGQAVLLQRLMQRVDELERQVQGMRGQLSEQERTIERQRARLDEVEEVARSQPAAPAEERPAVIDGDDPVRQDVPDEAVAAVTGDDADDERSQRPDDGEGAQDEDRGGDSVSDADQQALYNEAFEVLKSGKYEQAIDAFQKVIDANPRGEWAASAFFWQGETYYVQQDYAAAGKSYAELIERFPDSNRIPDAKLKLGYVAQERGDDDSARRLFNEVVEDHPDSQAAGLARQRLKRLGG